MDVVTFLSILLIIIIVGVIISVKKSFDLKNRYSEMEQISKSLNLTFLSDSYQIKSNLENKFSYFRELWSHNFVHLIMGNLKSNNNIIIFDRAIPLYLFTYELETICYFRNEDINLPQFSLYHRSIGDKLPSNLREFKTNNTLNKVLEKFILYSDTISTRLLNIFDTGLIDQFSEINKLYFEANGSEFIFSKQNKKLNENELINFMNQCDSIITNLISRYKLVYK